MVLSQPFTFTSVIKASAIVMKIEMQFYRFLSFGYPVPYRPVEDLAFAVARFFEKGGTFHNYYMVY